MALPIIDVIIPAYNEEESIGLVVADIPKPLVREIIVCNNASKDQTAAVAQEAGATVVEQPKMGYGSACLAGMDHISRKPSPPDIVVFIDGDYSDHPEEMVELVAPILNDEKDLGHWFSSAGADGRQCDDATANFW